MDEENVSLDPTPTRISIWGSAFWFGIPGLAIFLGVRFGIPFLETKGVDNGTAFILALYVPLACLVPLSLVLYRREGNPWSWPHFKRRFRIRNLSGKSWLAILGAFVAVQLAEGLLSVLSEPLRSVSLLKAPRFVPSPFNGEVELPLKEFLGFDTAGNHWLVPLWVGCLVANIAGEELMWRGYLLPRQELTHGRFAWLVHGLMWCFILHFFMPWQWLAILPSNLALPYLAQKTKSIWPSLVMHLAGNALVFAVLVPAL